MSRDAILRAIPHRPPMLLVDEIVEQSAGRIHCRKTYRDDEHFVQGHYPGQPIVPGVILCETGMQAGAVLLSQYLAGDGEQVPVATRLNNVKFKKMVRPGDTVDVVVELTEQLSGTFFLQAKISSHGKLATRFDFACTLANVAT